MKAHFFFPIQNIQLLQHHFLESSSAPYGIVWVSFVKIIYMFGPISEVSILFYESICLLQCQYPTVIITATL